MARIYGHSYRVEEALPRLGVKRLRNTPFMGVELELELTSGSDRGLVTDKVVELLGDDFVRCKYDGSLKGRGDLGVEIVTAPALLTVQAERWGRFFQSIPVELEATYRCGMHVHIERACVPDEVVERLVWFFNSEALGNGPFLQAVAGRRCDEFAQIHQLPKDRLATWKEDSDDDSYPFDRYTALNLTNRRTIEFRLFGSTTQGDVFLRRLEFSSAIVRWARTLQAREDASRKSFIEWLKGQEKRYPSLTGWVGSRQRFQNHEDGWDENGSAQRDDDDDDY